MLMRQNLHVYYVPFFDLLDAIFGMTFTVYNVFDLTDKIALTCETVPLSVEPLLWILSPK